jgi:hypothetical protein
MSKDVVASEVQVLATFFAVSHSILGRSITLSTGFILLNDISELGEARNRQGVTTSKDVVAFRAKFGTKPIISNTTRT